MMTRAELDFALADLERPLPDLKASVPEEFWIAAFAEHADALRAAAKQRLPVPAFRLGFQKSPWLVAADALAAYIDQRKAAAEADWKRLNHAA